MECPGCVAAWKFVHFCLPDKDLLLLYIILKVKVEVMQPMIQPNLLEYTN